MNIILTCAGRRNYLVNYFKDALAGKGEVIATDASKDAVALQDADRAFVLPFVSDPIYLDRLLAICQENQIKLLISLNDLELPLLANNRAKFLEIGVTPVVSSKEFIDICFDKWTTNQFLNKCDIKTPETYLTLEEGIAAIESGEIDFPLVIKPRWGSASIGIVYADDLEELKLGYHYVKKLLTKTILAAASSADPDRSVMIQSKIIGQEYGLDIINDLQGNYVTTSIKRKVSMRAGETDRAVTVTEPRLQEIGRKIGESTDHIGNLDCDVMIGDRGIFGLEMNPRFGGGYPFSHVAGVNLPSALITWANGDIIDPNLLNYQPNVMSSKCDRLIVY